MEKASLRQGFGWQASLVLEYASAKRAVLAKQEAKAARRSFRLQPKAEEGQAPCATCTCFRAFPLPISATWASLRTSGNVSNSTTPGSRHIRASSDNGNRSWSSGLRTTPAAPSSSSTSSPVPAAPSPTSTSGKRGQPRGPFGENVERLSLCQD